MRGVINSLILIAVVTGCSGSKRPSVIDASPGATPNTMPANWTPEKSEIRCASGECPPQVGLLVFLFPEAKGVQNFRKCTAFLTASRQIMSNGHCDFTDKAQGYFITAMTAPGGRQVRKIVRLHTKKYHVNPQNPDLDSGRPDAAVFVLDSAISMPPMILASLKDPGYSKLSAYVVNNAANGKFVIDRVNCDVRRHEAYFPFNLSENPDVLNVFNCATRKGNSGAPMLAPGSEKVQAIAQGSSDPNDLAVFVRKRFNRELRNYEKLWSVRATNVRCLDVPDGLCIANEEELLNARFADLQNKASKVRPGVPLEFNEWAEILPGR